jgi:hypothetical protein
MTQIFTDYSHLCLSALICDICGSFFRVKSGGVDHEGGQLRALPEDITTGPMKT